MDEYNHEDFEVKRTVDLFGGYEELVHKNKDIAEHTRFFRKSVHPDNHDEFKDLMALQHKVLGDGCSGTVHPVYERDGRKWVLLAVPEMHYHATGLPS